MRVAKGCCKCESFPSCKVPLSIESYHYFSSAIDIESQLDMPTLPSKANNLIGSVLQRPEALVRETLSAPPLQDKQHVYWSNRALPCMQFACVSALCVI